MTRINATVVKYFFQYRCERQLRYRTMPREQREAIPVLEAPADAGAWAAVGRDYEADVVRNLAARGATVLRPPTHQMLTEAETTAFLRRQLPQEYAHQLTLRPRPDDALHRRLRLDPSIRLAVAYPDLVHATAVAVPASGGPAAIFQLIDVKATQVATLFHKAQVAYYSLLLESALEEMGLDSPAAAINPVGEIWHYADAAVGADGRAAVHVTQFPLKGYRAQVIDFLTRIAPGLADLQVGPGVDETFFHLFFKCEQCPFLEHCSTSIQAPDPGDWDVSAVPGLTPQSKRALWAGGVRTVRQLAAAGRALAQLSRTSQALRTRGRALVTRAKAIETAAVTRFPGRFTHLMPPATDIAVYLLVDQDPAEGRLATVACRVDPRDGQDAFAQIVTQPGPQAEREALLTVLGRILDVLRQADAHNADPANADDPRTVHLFLYDPSEGADLQAALGRHLGDDGVRRGLLELLRIFPPDQFPVEPGYRKYHQLPATTLRTVFDALYALPVQVSHDLRAVSRALADHHPRVPAAVYAPGDTFARPFSSRLNIDACRALKRGELSADAVRADVVERLNATASLAQWLMAESAAVPAADGGPFLRLRKAPFRFQGTFDPLDAADLDLLTANELLETRAAELAALARLAEPAASRRERLTCVPDLQLLEHGSTADGRRRRLVFRGDARDLQSDLDTQARDVILTNDDPDLRLTPACWPLCTVRIADARAGAVVGQAIFEVEMWNGAWRQSPIRALVESATPPQTWCLDRAYYDPNAPRAQAFLSYLAKSGGAA